MHKYLKRALFYLIFFVFCFQVVSLVVVLNQPQTVLADEPIKYNLQVRLPDFSGDGGTGSVTIKDDTLGKYLIAVYKYSVAVVGILATVMIVVGGIIWLTSAGNATQITAAKSYITSAIAGLVLMLGSVTLLWLVNPQLINLSTFEVEKIKKIDSICCKSKKKSSSSAYIYWRSLNIVTGCGSAGNEVTDAQGKERCDRGLSLELDCDYILSGTASAKDECHIRCSEFFCNIGEKCIYFEEISYNSYCCTCLDN